MINRVWRLVGKRLVRPLFFLESKVRSQPDYQFTHRGETLEIKVFIFDAAPMSFDKDVIKDTASVIHIVVDALAQYPT